MTTKVQICGHRVLLRAADHEDEITEGALKGFKLDVGETHQREKAATVVGYVEAVGKMAWKAFDGADPDWEPWCKVGDKVYFAKFAGKFITIDDETYIIVNDEDIQAVILEPVVIEDGESNE